MNRTNNTLGRLRTVLTHIAELAETHQCRAIINECDDALTWMAERNAPPTPREAEFLGYLRNWEKGNREYGPSYRELMAMLGLASLSGLQRLVIQCERKGLIERDPFHSRSLRLTRSAMFATY